MPIRSKKQWKWLAANDPEMLRRWQRESRRNYKKLPTRVKKRKKK